MLVFTAIVVGALDPSLHLFDTSAVGKVTPAGADSAGAHNGGTVVAGASTPSTTDDQVSELLHSRSSWQGVSPGNMKKIGHQVCTALDNGLRGRDVVDIMVSSGASTDDAIYGLAVFVTAYCPEYSTSDIY